MKELTLKEKNRVIVKFINGRRPEDISIEERVPLDSIQKVINEWRDGYLNIEIGNEIAPELREIATMMKEKEISINDLIEGYHYYTIFKDVQDERIVSIVNALSSLDKDSRDKFLNTAQKMMRFSKYMNVDYMDIPRALDEMVARGKELQSEIKKEEFQLQESFTKAKSMKEEIQILENRIKTMSREISLVERVMAEFHMTGEDEDKLTKLLSGLKKADFGEDKIIEAGIAISEISSRGLTVDQFLKVHRYFEELMGLGLTVQTMQRILNDVKQYEVDIDEYLNERAMYVKDKIAYLKSLKELVEAHKRAEKQIKNLDEELERKKLKLARG
ncbi:MAG: hypothetical protein QW100_02680 [Thermoplasmatales archaeon]